MLINLPQRDNSPSFAIATANVGQTIYKRSQECLLLDVVV